jgi:hypothetical protein
VVPKVVDRRPVEKGMKLLRHDLQADEDYQGSEEESGPGQIAPVERHGDGIAAGSPSVVAAILIIQKASVTSAILLNDSGMSRAA